MDKLEKVERLRASAQVTYEEALAALDACGEDLLDAMVLLEKQGKVPGPGQGVYSTSYQEQKAYIDVPDQVALQKMTAPSFSKMLTGIFHTLIRFVKHTSFKISRHGRDILSVPSWLMVIAVLFSWKISLPAALIALLFGIRYSFEGEENTDAANQLLSKAGSLAESVKQELQKVTREEDKQS